MKAATASRLLIGDALEQLRTLPSESVHTCVTSPPYYNLRDYGAAGQIGNEASVEEYLQSLVSVFREVRRVLRADGTLWVNMGDSYATRSGSQPPTNTRNSCGHTAKHTPRGYKYKDLIGVPWQLAFALRADGWYLRQDIIWNKSNCMPESVRDRCTKSLEYIFLLSKSERYYFDAAAISEWMAAETWFTAQEALDAGFATSIAEAEAKAGAWNLSAYDNAPKAERAPAPTPEPAPEPEEAMASEDHRKRQAQRLRVLSLLNQ